MEAGRDRGIGVVVRDDCAGPHVQHGNRPPGNLRKAEGEAPVQERYGWLQVPVGAYWQLRSLSCECCKILLDQQLVISPLQGVLRHEVEQVGYLLGEIKVKFPREPVEQAQELWSKGGLLFGFLHIAPISF